MSMIHILGSDSGTEPMPGRKHTCWILEHEGELYWFDAGEYASWSAHNQGFDLLKVRRIFISHPHIDHTAGLPGLLWNIRKLMYVHQVEEIPPVELYTPDLPLVESVESFLESTGSSVRNGYRLKVSRIADGEIYRDSKVRVEARHTLHLGPVSAGEPWRAFSFRITLGKKVIVFSGDVKSIDDMGDWIQECDWLLMESGHHHPDQVCHTLAERKAKIGHLLWLHHGRDFLADVRGTLLETCIKAYPACDVRLAKDGMTVEV